MNKPGCVRSMSDRNYIKSYLKRAFPLPENRFFHFEDGKETSVLLERLFIILRFKHQVLNGKAMCHISYKTPDNGIPLCLGSIELVNDSMQDNIANFVESRFSCIMFNRLYLTGEVKTNDGISLKSLIEDKEIKGPRMEHIKSMLNNQRVGYIHGQKTLPGIIGSLHNKQVFVG